MAQLVSRLSVSIAGLQGGRQDQYSATFGASILWSFYANDRAVIILADQELDYLRVGGFSGVVLHRSVRESARIIAIKATT